MFDDDGNCSPDLLSAAEVTARRKTESGQFLPTTARGDTGTGAVVRATAQWLAGFDDNPTAFAAALETFVAPFRGATSEYPGQISGNCMGAAAPDGQFVVISPEQPLKTGDLAAYATTGGMQYIKILMGRRETPQGVVWIFGQASPPLVAFQREAELLFMHRVRAFADADGKESEIDLSPVAAELEWIAHLKIDGTWPPINSGFQPVVCEVA